VLILGVDLRKSPRILDRPTTTRVGHRGIQSQFAKRINRELGADFDVTAFRHLAYYNIERSRIEKMHLVSAQEPGCHIADHRFSFRTGESIRTEHSYKFDVA